MKRIFIVLMSLLIVIFLLSACQMIPGTSQESGQGQEPAHTEEHTQTSSHGQINVLAAESFLADIAQNVAGDRTRVDALIPIGVDPHVFEPTPQDIVKVADSNVLIVNGAGFEGWLQKTIDNVGGQHLVIEASAGLASRTIREGEVAEMSNAELADAMCESASESQAQKVESGQDSSNAVELPAESGMFDVRLNQQTDGTFSGYLRYSTDEAGDFQIAVGNGKVSLLNASNLEGLEIEKTLSLSCQDLTQGNIIGLEKDGHYVLALTGFKTANAHLLIGPAGGQHHHKGDPHFWLNPINVIKYVENIRDGLIRANPQGRDTYVENADQYMAKLNELDTWIVSQVNQIPPDRRLLVTNHESFGYFADRYGFKIIGTIVPSVSSESSPSAEQLARLIDRLRQTNPKAIFLETGTNPQLAQQVASETGIRVITQLYTHSITGPDGPAPTYLDMMRYDTQAIVEALK